MMVAGAGVGPGQGASSCPFWAVQQRDFRMCQMARLSLRCHHLCCLSRRLWTQSPAHCPPCAACCRRSCHSSFTVGVLPWCHCCCVLVPELPGPSQVLAIYSLGCISSARPVRKATTTCPARSALPTTIFSGNVAESSREASSSFSTSTGKTLLWHLSQRGLLPS